MEIVIQPPYFFAPMHGRLTFPGHTLTCIVKGTFDLRYKSKAVPSAKPLPPTGDKFFPPDEDMAGSLRCENDFAYFKLSADLLLAGHCYTPGGKPAQAALATFGVGGRSSTLAVFGNRYWKGPPGMRTISDPEPFTKMDLCYENSFGGPGFALNPVGKGFVKAEDESGKKVRPLPNIENPKDLIDSPSKHPQPVGFSPLGRMWKQRLDKAGSYGKQWLNERWPWFPKDFDWSYFNAAPPHMQMEGYLRGDETLYFENLHPVHPRYESQLPGLRVRCFTNKSLDDEKTEFQEVTMRLDTLWADMDAERIALVWRGATEVKDEDFEEICHVFIMDEPLDQPPASLERCHKLFLEELKKREQEWEMQPEAPPPVEPQEAAPPAFAAAGLAAPGVVASATAAAATIKDEKLAPPGKIAEPKSDKPGIEEIKAQAKAMMAKAGLDLDALPPEARKQMEAEMDRITAKLANEDPAKAFAMHQQEVEAQLAKSLTQAGIDIGNLPELSPKALAEQARFMKEIGMDPAMIEKAPELKQFFKVFSALLPKMGIDPENLDPLIENTKKHMGKIRAQMGLDEGE
jgi:hypothetical protein